MTREAARGRDVSCEVAQPVLSALLVGDAAGAHRLRRSAHEAKAAGVCATWT